MKVFNLIKLAQVESLPIPTVGKVTLRNLDEALERLSSTADIEGQGNMFTNEDG